MLCTLQGLQAVAVGQEENAKAVPKKQRANRNKSLPGVTPEREAAVLTFVRRSFGHEADPVTEDEVTRHRKAIGDRTKAWTADELLQVK